MRREHGSGESLTTLGVISLLQFDRHELISASLFIAPTYEQTPGLPGPETRESRRQ